MVEVKIDNSEAVRSFQSLNEEIDEAKDLLLNLDKTSAEYNVTLKKVANTQRELDDLNEAINTSSTTLQNRLENVNKVAGNLASGFSAVTGVMALAGVESEDFEKTMIKVQAVMAIASGIGGMGGFIKNLKALKTSLFAAKEANDALNTSILLNPYVMIAVAILAVTAAIYQLVTATDRAIEKLEKARALSRSSFIESEADRDKAKKDIIKNLNTQEEAENRLNNANEAKDELEANIKTKEEQRDSLIFLSDEWKAMDGELNTLKNRKSILESSIVAVKEYKKELPTQAEEDAKVESEKKKAEYIKKQADEKERILKAGMEDVDEDYNKSLKTEETSEPNPLKTTDELMSEIEAEKQLRIQKKKEEVDAILEIITESERQQAEEVKKAEAAKAKAKAETNQITQAGFDTAIAGFNAMSQLYAVEAANEKDGSKRKKELEAKAKDMAVMGVVFQTAQGIMNAITQAMLLPAFISPAFAVANSAIVAVSGLAQIKAIKSGKLEANPGGASGSGRISANPVNPYDFTAKEVNGMREETINIDEKPKDTAINVYISEREITNAQNNVKNRDNLVTF